MSYTGTAGEGFRVKGGGGPVGHNACPHRQARRGQGLIIREDPDKPRTHLMTLQREERWIAPLSRLSGGAGIHCAY